MSWAVGGYTDIRDLGRGASGRVVLAKHDLTGTHVAIKYLADHLAGDEEFLRAFRAEARILSELDDPQVAKLYEYVETTEGAAIVMELVDGVALRAILREHGPTDPPAALVVLKGSLLGLAATHARGVVHRDYKPENVLVNGEGQSKLADFGIATRAGREGVPAGTPSYMAPEQWTGGPASPSTDIYAATATFFECLTGRPPYRSPGDLMGLRRQHEHAPIPLEQVPDAVRELVRRGLDKQPDRRPRDAASFLQELEAVAGAGYGAGWEEEGRRSLARRAALLLLLFPLAGAVGGGTGVGQTILGMSTRVRNLLIGAATTVIVAAGGIGGFVALDPGSSEEPITAPSVSVSLSAPPSIEASPSPTPAVSPSPFPTPSPTRSTTPPDEPDPPNPPKTSAPTKPALKVTSLGIADYCWIYKDSCGDTYRHTDSRVRLRLNIVTTNQDKINLLFQFVRVQAGKPAGQTVSVYRSLQGETKYEVTFTDIFLTEIAPLECDDVRLTVSVSNVVGEPRPSDFIDNSCFG